MTFRQPWQQFMDTVSVQDERVRAALYQGAAAIAAGNNGEGISLLTQVLRADPRVPAAWLWLAYAVDEIDRKRDCLKHVLALSDEREQRAGMCLLEYEYPELKGVSDTVRRDFAFSAAWKRCARQWIWDGADEPLVVVMGTDYVLDLDVGRIEHEMATKLPDNAALPISYTERGELWPDLVRLQSLSVAARKAFVRAMQMVDLRSGFVDYRPGLFVTDHYECTPGLEDALEELHNAGFMDLHPTPDHLLVHLTGKDLKRFAFAHGVKPAGSKSELAHKLLAQVPTGEIESLLAEALRADARLLRVTMSELKLLKKYIWAEKQRLDLYVESIYLLRGLDWSPPQWARDRLALPHGGTAEKLHRRPWGQGWGDPRSGWRPGERALVQGIWDAECDQIVTQLTEIHAWNALWEFGDAIAAHVPTGQLEQFKKDCEAQETRAWYNLLMDYGRLRVAEMGVPIRKARLVKCLHCQTEFLESSVAPSLVKRVGCLVQYCSDCLETAFYETRRPTATAEEMLKRLADLADVLAAVPSATFVQNPSVTELSDDKLIAVLAALMQLPTYKAYVETFGSWLQALVLAGVLEDGTQRTSRGVRCVADDGHPCLSLGEKTVDDWLSARRVVHDIEPYYPEDRELNPMGQLRADWKVGDTLIEYAGMMDEPEYAARITTKQELAKRLGIPLIVLEPADVVNLESKLGHLAVGEPVEEMA